MTPNKQPIKEFEEQQDLLTHHLSIGLYEHFPFLKTTLFGISPGKIASALLIFLLFLLLSRLFSRLILNFIKTFTQKTQNRYDDRIIDALGAPLTFALLLIGAKISVTMLISDDRTIERIFSTLFLFVLFWMIVKIISTLDTLFYKAAKGFNKALAKELGSFTLKIVKAIIIVIGFGAILKVWGIDISALVASLGLGGLAFALAAKDTAANLFGSFALLADKSMRIGEWIKVGNIEGVVEDIGMRTTKIRTFEKSLISVPNSMIANSPLENFSRRNTRRIKFYLGLSYETPSEALSKIINQIEQMLRSHPGIAQDETLIVKLEHLGESSLNIFIYTFADTADWLLYLEVRQSVLLECIHIAERNGAQIAYPTQSIYIEKMPYKEGA